MLRRRMTDRAIVSAFSGDHNCRHTCGQCGSIGRRLLWINRESNMSSSSSNRIPQTQDDELINAARNGSSHAMGELLQSCRAYLLAIGESELTADLRIKVSPSDLVQETSVQAQRAMPTFRGQTQNEFRMWVRGIFMHQLAQARRKFKGTEGRDIGREVRQLNSSSILELSNRVLDNETPSRMVIRKEDQSALRQAIARLPEDYRQVIRLCHFDLVSFAEMGRTSGRTQDAMYRLWLRALKRLKEELHGHDPS